MDELMEILIPKAAHPTLELPDPDLLQYYKNLEDRVYWIDDEVNDSILELVARIIEWNREDKDTPIEARKPIRIMFNSPGGSLDIEEIIVSIIKLSKTPVYGFALGMVASAASLIFLSCHKRYALNSSYLVLHKGSCSNMGGNYNEVAAAMEDYKKQVEKMTQFYIDNTLYSEEEIRKNIETDWYIRGDELKDKGLIHEWVEDISILL